MNIYIAIIILIIYIYCYFIYPSDIVIYQSTLKEFELTTLYKRQPIVIQDKVINIKSVIDSWFNYNIIQDIEYTTKYDWNINSHKYLLIYTVEDAEILLYKAGNKIIDSIPDNKEITVAIKLKANQSLIIPFRWYYNIKNNDIFNIKLYGIHDYVTVVLDYLI